MWIVNQEGRSFANLEVTQEITIREYRECFGVLAGCAELGNYETEERAKEVVEDILQNLSFGITVYRMPQE